MVIFNSYVKLPIKNSDVPIKNSDLPVKIVIFPSKFYGLPRPGTLVYHFYSIPTINPWSCPGAAQNE
jgi:hypothetical protein